MVPWEAHQPIGMLLQLTIAWLGPKLKLLYAEST